ncbi:MULTISPECIES: glutamate ABC transporter substrate-binding protein [Thermocrispum]|mgnify:CR=1 FL=1|jgi:glutamate transport system substrate-binding protein|uniref:Glutamate ABC transporter substrate-binding protein n=1 Tax=Thermocrispum agreste TaxID=37925 RepID=A0A2W4JPN8_9PSEU|nr:MULTISPECIES: glutamate ABC transporter substrate-binding protein [Thermocrispum]PZN01003.1 MAG: glutamate-binding protein [Thermocrispum agreste]
MRISRVLRAGAAIAAASLALVACADPGGGGDDKETIKVGIKFDQPGMGQKQGADTYTGFDVELAKFIAKELGYEEDQIEFKEAVSKDRENMLKNGDVAYIVGTYSITDERKEVVDFVGPYFIAHQDLLVRKDFKDLTKEELATAKIKLCSVTGSTSAANVKETLAKNADLKEYNGYSQCVDALKSKAIDALTTDDTILAGYAAQNEGQFKLLGLKLTDEHYGVGLPKNSDIKDKVKAAVQKWIDEGHWQKAAEKYLGPADYDIPEPPQLED